MNQAEIKAQLNSLTANIDTMSADAKSVIMVLVNLVEVLAEQNALLKAKCQLLTDEINRLKGEQGKLETLTCRPLLSMAQRQKIPSPRSRRLPGS